MEIDGPCHPWSRVSPPVLRASPAGTGQTQAGSAALPLQWGAASAEVVLGQAEGEDGRL